MLLTQSIQHRGAMDFDDILRREIDENRGHLPLERLCRYGGFPSYETLSVHIDSHEVSDDGIIEVRCSVYFTEVISSNCAVCSFEKPANGFLLLKVEKDGCTEVQVLEVD